MLFYWDFSEEVASVSLVVILFLLLIFVTMPILFGYLKLLYAAYEKQRVYVFDIFLSFSPKNYFKVVWAGILLLLRILLVLFTPLVMALMCYELFEHIFGTTIGVVIDPILNFLFILFSVGVFIFFSLLFSLILTRGYLNAYYMLKGEGVFRSYTMSRKALKGKTLKTFSLKLLFIGVVIISVLSIATLFLVTVPLMAFAYFIYAKDITENINEL